MVRASSEDLQSRVMNASWDGMSARRAAARFGIGISTAIRWIGRARIDERTARPQGWRRGSTLDSYEAFTVGLIEEQQDITLDEMVVRLDGEASVRIGRSALSDGLRRRGWTFKNVWLAPSASDFLTAVQSAPTYSVSEP